MAHALPTWHEPEAVLSLATLGVAEREGVGRNRHHRAPHRARRRRPNPLLRHASSRHLFLLIRRRVAAGQPIRYLVPDAVASYIDTAELYR